MNELLALLEEAYVQVNEMRKVADSSVADYILNLEVAMHFITRALNTKDRLDIFKALQKAYDVLEREEESYEDEEQDGYDELVDRLKAALDGLNEGIFMKKSELKSLTKAILKEIYMKPEQPDHPLAQLFQKLTQKVVKDHPEFNDIPAGHSVAHKIVKAIIVDIKFMIKHSISGDKNSFAEGVERFEHHTQSLMHFMVAWAQQIHEEFPQTEEQIDRAMSEFKGHLEQVGTQFKEVFVNTRVKNDLGKRNVINSIKQMEHLNEIFNRLKESIDGLFQIGLSAGYGKKK